jgi:hypothetical protein
MKDLKLIQTIENNILNNELRGEKYDHAEIIVYCSHKSEGSASLDTSRTLFNKRKKSKLNQE